MSVKKFLVHYSHYFFAIAASQLLGLISFPILTRVLSTEEYGVMGFIVTTMILLVALAKGGLSDGIIRYYREYSESREKMRVFASTVFLRGLTFSTVVTVIYLLTIPLLLNVMDVDFKYESCFYIMGAYLFVKPLNTIVLNILRITERTIFFNAVNFFSKGLSIAFSLILLLFLIGDFYGYFAGLVLAEAGVGLLLYIWFFSKYPVSFKSASFDLTGNLMKFGMPLLLTESTYLLLSYSDRFMIMKYLGEAELGMYSVGYNLAAYLGDVFTFAVAYAVVPIYVNMHKNEGSEKTAAFLRQCLNYLLMAMIPMGVLYFSIAEDLITVLASTKYSQAAVFSPIIFVGLLFFGLNSVLNAGLYLQKKTTSILFVMFAAIVINIGLNFLLIPAMGSTGASISVLIACVSSSFITVLLSRKHLSVSAQAGTIIYYACCSLALYAALSFIEGPALTSLVLKVIISALGVGAAVLVRERALTLKLKTALLPQKQRL